MQAVTS